MNRRLHILALLISLILSYSLSREVFAQVIINEFQAINTSSIKDPDFNEFADWIELYNSGSSSIDISSYFIADNAEIPGKWVVPEGTSIPPEAYLLLWADGTNTGLHTSFKLSGAGEEIYLFHSGGTMIDSIIFGAQQSDYSYGRNPSGDGWLYFANPTPGEVNAGVGFAGISGNPSFSVESGFYDAPVSVALAPINEEAIIRYTTDGTAPSISSSVYQNPISISSTTIVRAREYQEGMLPGKTVNQTYFIDDPNHTLPVISLFTNPDHLWDPASGIYVNYTEDWERPCGFEYFLPGGESVVNINGGFKIFGGASRGFAQKSMAIYARSRYGDGSIDYPLMPGRETTVYKSFILRNSGNDWQGTWRGTLFRDALIHINTEGQMDLDYQAYQPVVVYLNGEYWGIQNIRDKHNEEYCGSNYDLNPDSIDIIKNNELIAGSEAHYNELMGFLENNDLSNSENYTIAASMIDIDEFINYMITEIYSCNIDWPANNYRLWRPSAPGGKWRWMMFDTDFGFNGFEWAKVTTNMFDKALDPDINDYVHKELKAPWATRAFIKLTGNEEFRNRFISTYLSHIYSTYDPDRIIHIVDSLSNNLADEMPRHIARWGSEGGIYSMDVWENNVETMRDFARERPPYALAHLESTFDLQNSVNIEVNLHCERGGKIILNGIPLDHTDYSGVYYPEMPLELTVAVQAGYTFVEWLITDSGVNSGESFRLATDTLKVTTLGDLDIVAHLEKRPEVPDIFINEIVSYNSSEYEDEYGDSDDWIEVYNAGDAAVDMGGLYLTDSLAKPRKWMIPESQPEITTIEPGGFIVFWADNEPDQGVLHLGFKLNREGEQVGLYQELSTSMVLLDSVTFPLIYPGHSYNRYPDGVGPWVKSVALTPGYFNESVGKEIHETVGFNLVIYPNPARDFIRISIQETVNGSPIDKTEIVILDELGHVIQRNIFTSSGVQEMNISGIPAGFYMVRIIIGDHCITRKVSVVK